MGADGIIFDGTFKVGQYTADFTGNNAIVVSDYANSGGIMYLDLNQAALETLNAAMQANHKLSCTIVGTVSGQPVSYTINIYLEAIVYGEA